MENTIGGSRSNQMNFQLVAQYALVLGAKYSIENGGRGNGGNGDARITNKQLSYIVNLGKNLNWDFKDLDEKSVRIFGVKMAYLTIKDASSFIETLKIKAA